MSTIITRRVASTPARTASETWAAIVGILIPQAKPGGGNHAQLERVGGVASSLISSETPKSDAIVVYGGGSRVRIYCAYDGDALTREDLDEDPISQTVMADGWQMSLPCGPDDLVWVQKKLKALSSCVTARAMGEAVSAGEGEASGARSELKVDLKEFLKP